MPLSVIAPGVTPVATAEAIRQVDVTSPPPELPPTPLVPVPLNTTGFTPSNTRISGPVLVSTGFWPLLSAGIIRKGLLIVTDIGDTPTVPLLSISTGVDHVKVVTTSLRTNVDTLVVDSQTGLEPSVILSVHPDGGVKTPPSKL